MSCLELRGAKRFELGNTAYTYLIDPMRETARQVETQERGRADRGTRKRGPVPTLGAAAYNDMTDPVRKAARQVETPQRERAHYGTHKP